MLNISALYVRVLGLFGILQDMFHMFGCDNLYISVNLCKEAYNHHSKVIINAMCRHFGRGFPSVVIQREVKIPGKKKRVNGMVTDAILVRDPLLSDLVAICVHDTKPISFLSMCCETVQWVKKSRQIYDSSTKIVKMHIFFFLNINGLYNKEMGDMDITDQIRGTY